MKYVFKKKLYLIVAFVSDVIGSVVFFPAKLFRHRLPDKPNRMLVIRVDHIGDVISASAVLGPLRKRFPDSRIDFMAPSWASDILKDNPFIDKLIKFDAPWFDRKSPGFFRHFKGLADMVRVIKSERYDVTIDLRGDVRHITSMFLAGVNFRLGYGITGGSFLLTHCVPYKGVIHETERNMALLSPLGIKGSAPKIKLYFSKDDTEKAAFIEKKYRLGKDYAVFHTVPGHSTKKWDTENFARLTRYIRDKKGLTPVMIGTQDDREQIKKVIDIAGDGSVDLSGKTDLAVLGKLLSEASLFVGLDSAPAHIAAAVGTPTLVLFSGINEPEQWAPKGEGIRVIYPGKGKDLSAVGTDKVCRAIDEMLRGTAKN